MPADPGGSVQPLPPGVVSSYIPGVVPALPILEPAFAVESGRWQCTVCCAERPAC